MMRVEKRGNEWWVYHNADLTGMQAGPFETNAAAWKWLDRNTNEGGEEGDHAGRQDWSIKRHLLAE